MSFWRTFLLLQFSKRKKRKKRRRRKAKDMKSKFISRLSSSSPASSASAESSSRKRPYVKKENVLEVSDEPLVKSEPNISRHVATETTYANKLNKVKLAFPAPVNSNSIRKETPKRARKLISSLVLNGMHIYLWIFWLLSHFTHF